MPRRRGCLPPLLCVLAALSLPLLLAAEPRAKSCSEVRRLYAAKASARARRPATRSVGLRLGGACSVDGTLSVH
ncbi:hypothetical protein DUI87_03388 [Hirundo rustica rustica]|uniref:Uncharacterized protein n=1 Tax=Hirundo rustica rustica TaxID=333673 RepID=A0A3M0L3J6_HIRRU|nr:hypothetical protein DUI87_03388 [Hirundo rustica rustica]